MLTYVDLITGKVKILFVNLTSSMGAQIQLCFALYGQVEFDFLQRQPTFGLIRGTI